MNHEVMTAGLVDTFKKNMREYYRKFPIFTDTVYKEVAARLAPEIVDSKPEKITHRADVVIAGGGLIGALYARGLQIRGLKVLVIEPESNKCNKALNVSQEIFDKACTTFDKKILVECVTGDIGEGHVTFFPAEKPNFRGKGVLNVSLNAPKFQKKCYEALQSTNSENHGELLTEKFVSYKKYAGKIYAITDQGSTVECYLMLHDMGPDDFLARYINKTLEIDHVPTVGVEAQVVSNNPSGSLLQTLMNAVDGYQDIWEFLADKKAPKDQKRLAVVYLFTRYQHDTTQKDLDRLTERFLDQLYDYGETVIEELDRFLFGDIVMVRDFDKVIRSINDNIRLIGFFDFSNPTSGAHFEEQLKEGNLIMDQLTRGVKKRKKQLCRKGLGIEVATDSQISDNVIKGSNGSLMQGRADVFNPLSRRRLERMRSSLRQRASTNLTRAFARALDAEGKKPDCVNNYMTMMLKMYRYIDNPLEKARMLYNMIPAGVAAEFFFDLVKDKKLKPLVIALKEINVDLKDVVGSIMRSYSTLLLCEFGEVGKHIGIIISQILAKFIPGIKYEKGAIEQEAGKIGAHLSRISKSHPEKMTLGGLTYFLNKKSFDSV